MGIRVALTAFEPLDRLLVLGVKASLTAEAATARLESMLDAHHYARGLALLAPGTPTNNTAEADAGFTKRDEGGFEVEVAPPRIATGSDGAELARLLGIKLSATDERRRRGAAGGHGRAPAADRAVAGHRALLPRSAAARSTTVLGRGAWTARSSSTSTSCARRGRCSMLRIGRQPYGLVPAMSLDLFADQGRFVRTLRGLALRLALGAGPGPAAEAGLGRRGAPGRDPAHAAACRSACARGRSWTAGRSRSAAPRRRSSSRRSACTRACCAARLRPLGELAHDERIFDALPAGGSAPLTAAAAGDIKTLRTATFDALLAEQPTTLLRALLRHSLLLAQATLAQRRLAPGETYREPALVDVLGPEQPVRIETLMRVLDRDPALRATIHSAPELEELRTALQFLETVPQDGLGRHLAGVLDLFSYRLDAWITGLATRRLGELRKQTPRGLALGGFGWVEDLKPEPQAPVRVLPPGEQGPLFAARERGGAIHAPSMPQASAAAVLRSGYLNEPSSALRRRPALRAGAAGGVPARRRARRPAAVGPARLPLRARPARARAGQVPARLPARVAPARAGRGAGAARVRDRHGRHRLALAAGRGHADDRGRGGGGARAVQHARDGDGGGPGEGRHREHRRRAGARLAVPREHRAVHAIGRAGERERADAAAGRAARARPGGRRSGRRADRRGRLPGRARQHRAGRGERGRARARRHPAAGARGRADAAHRRGGHAPAADAVLRDAGARPADRRARRAGAGRAGARALAAPDARRPAPRALRAPSTSTRPGRS